MPRKLGRAKQSQGPAQSWKFTDYYNSTDSSLAISDAYSKYDLTYTTVSSVAKIGAAIDPGRRVTFFNTSSNTVTLNHTAFSSATAGQMVFAAGSNFSLAQGKMITLEQDSNGVFRQFA
jgi:hypothetical protein